MHRNEAETNYTNSYSISDVNLWLIVIESKSRTMTAHRCRALFVLAP